VQNTDDFDSDTRIIDRDISRLRALPIINHTDVQPNAHGGVLWMTGLSGAGKSTLAKALKERLEADRVLVTVLDGDVLRTGLNAGLGFSSADRHENIRRTAEVAALFSNAGFVVVCALISPAMTHRNLARTIIGDRFFEVHIQSDLEVCESRDPKGLYAKARKGQIPEFTGISSPYEAPLSPELTIDTARSTIAESVAKLQAFVRNNIAPRHLER
jgi:adenylylsulfate kinase